MIGSIQFPVYKLGKITNIEKMSLGKIYINTIRGRYLLDDISIKASTLGKRRLVAECRGDKLYKLRGKVDTLKQLIKFPSNTRFVDSNGYLFNYKKSKKRYKVVSKKILDKVEHEDGYIIQIKDYPTPHYVPSKQVVDNCNYVSVMLTDNGPLIYDYTTEEHKPLNRSY